jgi:ATP-binding cassette, subfamily C, bacterial CydC
MKLLTLIPKELRAPTYSILPALFISSLLQSAGFLVFAWSLSVVLNSFLFKQQAGSTQWLLAILAGAFVRFIGQWLESKQAAQAALQSENLLRHQMLQFARIPSNLFNSAHFSNVFSRGPLHLSEYIRIYIPAKIKAMTIPVVLLIVLYYVDWLSALILTIATPFMVILLILTGTLSEKKRQQKWAQLSALRAELLNQIRGLAVTKQLGAQHSLFGAVQSVSNQFRSLTVQVLQIVFLSALVLELTATISTALIAVQAGIRLSTNNMHYTIGLFVLLITPEFFKILRELGAARHSAMEWESASQKYQELLNPISNAESEAKNSPTSTSAIINPNVNTDANPNINSNINSITNTGTNKNTSTKTSTQDGSHIERPPIYLIVAALLLGILAPLTQAGLLVCGGLLLSLSALHIPIYDLHVPVAGVRFFGLARAATRYLERLTTHNASLALFATMRIKILNTLLHMSGSTLRKLHSGALLRTVDQDTEEIDMLLPGVLFPVLSALFITVLVPWIPPVYWFTPRWLFIGILWTLWIWPWFFWFLLPGSPQLEQLDEIGVELADTRHELMGTPNWDTKCNQLLQAGSAVSTQSHQHMYRTKILSALQAAFIPVAMVLLAMHLSFDNTQQYRLTAAILFGLLGLSELYGNLPNCVAQAKSSLEAINRIHHLPNEATRSQSVPADWLQNGIQLQNLTFSYPQGRVILNNLSLQIAPHSFTAILGSVGCGKTTLLELLTGFLPIPPHSIMANSTTGSTIDFSTVDPMQLSQSFAYLSQKSHLFTGTIADNLLLANSQASPTQLEQMMHLVGFNTVSTFTLTSFIGENGALLSGGERQRLLLARTFLLQRDFLLLDEPFNNLDKETRLKIIQYLEGLKGRITLILVTHQADGLEQMDSIIRI